MRNLALIFSLAVLSMVIYAFSEKDKAKQFDYLGQAAPPDMEFIPGNDSIPSFFISKSQETNLNYLAYLNWLNRIYMDYPQIAKDATPHDLPEGDLMKFNDPILKGQLRNPAFAYYPVTGVDWLQVQQYTGWKTDRLNERILIELKYFKENPDQVNEENFNYEAFMAYQYYGAVKKLIPGRDYSYEAAGKIPDNATVYPFLLPGYRLPTEAEWEYVSKDEFRNTHFGNRQTYPYGKSYFLLDVLTHRLYGGEKSLMPYIENAGVYEPGDAKRIKGATSYNNSYYGVYNMGDNVKEWMMDEYTPAVKHYPNAEAIYSGNGFVIAVDSLYRDEEGNIMGKDSMGRMYYRTMGIAKNGEDFRVMQYRFKVYRYYSTRVPNPDSVNVRIIQRKNINNAWVRSGNTIYNSWLYYYGGPQGRDLSFYKFKKKGRSQWLEPDTTGFVDSYMNSEALMLQRNFITSYHRKLVFASGGPPRSRVVKTGTWKNPSITARESMKENEASADIGFRTVMPYIGLPIDKKNKVKWK